MKKMLSSFVVTGVLTVGNISAIASEYIKIRLILLLK